MFHLLHDKVHRAVSKPILARDDLTSTGTSSGKNFAGTRVSLMAGGRTPQPLSHPTPAPLGTHKTAGCEMVAAPMDAREGCIVPPSAMTLLIKIVKDVREAIHRHQSPGLTAHARVLTSCAHSWHARAEMCGGQQHYFLWLIQGQGLRFWVIFKLLPSFLPNFIDLRRNTLPSSLPLSLHTRKCLRPEEYSATLCNP